MLHSSHGEKVNSREGGPNDIQRANILFLASEAASFVYPIGMQEVFIHLSSCNTLDDVFN